jgi:signal transduction histidine kinase
MNCDYLEQLQDCCRDREAFERMQNILKDLYIPSQQARSIGRKMVQQQALFQVISKIRETIDLDSIFKTAVVQVRQLMEADRVGIFRFEPDSSWNDGEFVSEDVLPQFSSVLSTRVRDYCFGDEYAHCYQQGQIQAVANIYNAGLQLCHLDVLRSFQIRANLVVPLLQGKALWGLLCVHQCAAPRQWQAEEIEFVQQVATQLGVALQQADLLEQTKRQSTDLAAALESLQKSHRRIMQSEKMSSLGQLVAGIADEIHNPANFIYGNLSHADQYASQLLELLALYQQEHSSPSHDLSDRIAEADLNFLVEDFPKTLSSMRFGADRIRQLVLSLHSFLQSDETEMMPVDLQEGLDNTLLMLQHRLKAKAMTKAIAVVKEYGYLPQVEGYASHCNQVFLALLNRAIDDLEAIEAHDPSFRAQITIRTLLIPPDRVGGVAHAVIQIADNGAGIPEESQTNLFKASLPHSTETHQSTELSVVHKIITEQHGGEIHCYSQLGQGTEFWIELPVQQSVSSAVVDYAIA